jgi:DNA-binding MarR family transcriptional regulator
MSAIGPVSSWRLARPATMSRTTLRRKSSVGAYLERVPDVLDRRARLIRPTAKGRIVHRVAHRKLEELEERWRAEIGDHHWRQLRSALGTLAHLG